MDKLETAIKKVERYENKVKEVLKKIEEMGIDPETFYASFPAGSVERITLNQLRQCKEDLSRAQNELENRKRIEAKKEDKKSDTKKIENKPIKWMQSAAGTWHKFCFTLSDGVNYPNCQSYNLDRPNPLHGEALDIPPEGATVCKKCQSKSSGKKWD